MSLVTDRNVVSSSNDYMKGEKQQRRRLKSVGCPTLSIPKFGSYAKCCEEDDGERQDQAWRVRYPSPRRFIDRIGPHASQTTLGQGRAYSAVLADSGLLGPSRAPENKIAFHPFPHGRWDKFGYLQQ